MKKLEPIKFTGDALSQLNEQTSDQQVQKAAPKSRDPKNFPVFEVPVNQKRLVYVPNHVVTGENGTDELRMDKPFIHAIEIGKRFINLRCISGIVIDGVYDGECPVCEGVSDPWDLANEIIKETCAAQGLDPEDKENPTVKSIRSTAYSDRKVKDANRYYTFPICVFDTVNNDGKTLVQDENGNYKVTPMWYTISESKYKDTWEKTLEGMEDEPSHPGGHFFTLNYCYTPKKGEPNKRDSARNLSVSPKNIKNAEEIKAALDKATEDWTPQKARETVVDNAFYSEQELQEFTDDALETTRNLLAIYEAKRLGTGATTEDDNSNFKLEKKEEVPDTSVSLDTDLDVE